ncbi:DUF177 domain-containing protein [Tianweitania populi]|uniref:Metal-binding protein n=1 Tax=Tianweitania populi TaxID=1607949 RepID=A0A8J3GJ31_9HYPH|nr:DUF177 domain-containing protein [Tianweitania populi]GHD07404.1 metal-binding protein [Tianweitania populi]
MNTTKSPVSFPVSINRLPSKGMPVRIEADADMRAALAEAHDLVSVERFVADVMVTDWKGSGVAVNGKVEAKITQACIVTLEPLTARIDEAIEATFLPRNSKLHRLPDPSDELMIDPDGPDAPEILEGDTVDVGALAEEIFALAIDPYPRKEGVETLEIREDSAAPMNPLAEKLAALKDKL